MHFTGTVYRNPYWPTRPLLEEARLRKLRELGMRGKESEKPVLFCR